jgi:hypothetical protein
MGEAPEALIFSIIPYGPDATRARGMSGVLPHPPKISVVC